MPWCCNNKRYLLNCGSNTVSMASTLLFDPLVALRAAPLVSATCSLLFAYEQHFFLSIINRPQIRPHSKRLLPSYFTIFFGEAVVQVLGFLGLTVATSLTNLYWDESGTGYTLGERGSYWWYAAAASFAASHLLYAPVVFPSVHAIRKNKEIEKGKDVNDALDVWLRVNWMRMMTVDLVAWLATVIAVGKAFSA